jgi:HTH-type transcriptional regulator / antitoxin HigA
MSDGGILWLKTITESVAAMSTVKSRNLHAIEVADDYLRLIKRFPLRTIRTKAEFGLAGELLDELVGNEHLTAGQRDYLDGLVRFVRDYEAAALGAKLKKLTPVQVLKHLLEENGMNTSDLGAILGSRGLASEVMNGKRPNRTVPTIRTVMRPCRSTKHGTLPAAPRVQAPLGFPGDPPIIPSPSQSTSPALGSPAPPLVSTAVRS